MKVSDDKSTLWVRLPVQLQTPINGGCDCGKCNNHPMWDALAIDTKTGDSVPVHFPDLSTVKPLLYDALKEYCRSFAAARGPK